MDSTLLLITGLALLTFCALYRAAIGPTLSDRLVATAFVTNITIMIIALLAVFSNDLYFLDVALVFVLCSFVTIVAILKGLTKGKLS